MFADPRIPKSLHGEPQFPRFSWFREVLNSPSLLNRLFRELKVQGIRTEFWYFQFPLTPVLPFTSGPQIFLTSYIKSTFQDILRYFTWPPGSSWTEYSFWVSNPRNPPLLLELLDPRNTITLCLDTHGPFQFTLTPDFLFPNTLQIPPVIILPRTPDYNDLKVGIHKRFSLNNTRNLDALMQI